MADQLHPAAVHHLPSFITAPGETDVLMVGTAVFLGICVIAFGILYFRLHSLPEHIAHKAQKVQFELVAVLGLISLFTHMHIFWIVGLLLAFIDIPDFGNFLGRIAGSVERLAGVTPGQGGIKAVRSADHRPVSQKHDDASAQEPAPAAARPKELDHA